MVKKTNKTYLALPYHYEGRVYVKVEDMNQRLKTTQVEVKDFSVELNVKMELLSDNDPVAVIVSTANMCGQIATISSNYTVIMQKNLTNCSATFWAVVCQKVLNPESIIEVRIGSTT